MSTTAATGASATTHPALVAIADGSFGPAAVAASVSPAPTEVALTASEHAAAALLGILLAVLALAASAAAALLLVATVFHSGGPA